MVEMVKDPRQFGVHPSLWGKMQSVFSSCSRTDQVILFGSRARGDYSPLSDLDLLVHAKALSAVEKNVLADRIKQLPTPLKIDVLFADQIEKHSLIENIQKEGVVIYDKSTVV
jgi:predicted nucleotidyltransferase